MAAVQESFSAFVGSLWSFWWRWLPHDCIHSVVLPLMFRRVSVAAMGYEHVWGKCLATVDELLFPAPKQVCDGNPREPHRSFRVCFVLSHGALSLVPVGSSRV